MLDILRSLTRTAEEKRQEELNAYLDGELHGRARVQFETRLAAEPELRAEMAQLRAVKAGVEQLPRVRAPRSYTLDPAVYGRRAPARATALYPTLRVATVLTAFLLVLALGLEIMPGSQTVADTAEEVALVESTAEEVAVEEAGETAAMEAPAEPMMQEADETAERSAAADGAAPAEGEADIAGAAPITATGTVTDDATLMAAPELETAAVEDAAEEEFEEAEEPAAAAAPLELEGTPVAAEAVAAATAPPAPTPTPAPAQAEAREGIGLEPLRFVQAVLGVAFVVLLTATLLLRRQRV